MMLRSILYILCPLMLFLLQGCSSLERVGQVMEGKRPTAQVQSVRLTGLDLQGIDLLFDVNIHNPNDFPIDLADFDYDLQLFGQPFIKGRQSKGISLAAKSGNRVALPLRLGLRQLFNSYRQLKQAERVSYRLDLGLGFKMPVIGSLRLPVTYEDEFPLPRIPDFTIQSLAVERLALNQAEVVLKLGIDNPNDFSLMLQQLDYHLKLNGAVIGKGLIRQSVDISQGGSGVVNIPLTIDLAQAGRGLYSALLGLSDLRYELKGAVQASGHGAVLKRFKIPLDKQGIIQLK
jgi:LEA14-like dessication related protein